MDKRLLGKFHSIIEEPIKISTFPSYFQTLVTIRDIVTSKDTTLSEMTEVIQLEPLLTVKILKAAKLASARSKRELRTLDDAVRLLGYDTVKRVVLAVSLAQLVQSRSLLIYSEITRLVWLNSIYAAAASAVLGKSVGISEKEVMFRSSFTSLGIFYLFYRISQDPELSESLPKFKTLILKYSPEKTMQILDYFDIAPLIFRTVKTYLDENTPYIEEMESIPEVIYNAYLLAFKRYDWFNKKTPIVIPEVSPMLLLKIEQKYTELRKLFD